MSNLIAARSQMAMSLAFHIIFASVGIAMPVMMVIAEWRWLRRRDEVALVLAQRWAKGTAILFAVGAVSGTVLSFELGLLWPMFMDWAGGAIGLLFALEGFAFFTEAIFLGIYLYGWNRVSPLYHLGAGVIVAVSGVASAVFVVIVNAWMNTPAGLEVAGGQVVHVDPVAAMTNPSAVGKSVHMVLAAFAATGFAVAGIHAWLLASDPRNRFHELALSIALLVGGVPAILQPLSGDVLARQVAQYQPVKLAAFEALFHTEQGAAFRIGGTVDMAERTVRHAIEVPHGLSVLLYYDPHATVQGLDAFPPEDWPPVGVVHWAFQIMVGAGLMMAAIAIWAVGRWWRRGSFSKAKWLLRAIVLVSPLGFIATEAGWVVTEVGRQPWIISGLLRTSQAVTPMPGLIVPLILFTVVYLLLAAAVIWLLVRQIRTASHIDIVRQ